MLSRLLSRILFLSAFCIPALAQEAAGEPTPSDAVVPADAVPTEDTATEETPPVVSTRTINELLESARELEREGGPFDPQLGEQLASLGMAYQHNGQHEDAVEILERAMHIKRVNDGLQDLGQLAILQQLIQSRIATENWDDLDKSYQLLLWLHRRNFEPGDARFLPVVEQMGRWKLQAYKEDLLDQSPEATLREADELFHDTIRLLQNLYGETDSRLVESLYGKALANYAVMSMEARKSLSEFDTGAFVGVPRISYRQVCRQVVTPGGPRTVCQTIQVPGGVDMSRALDQQRQKEFNIQKRMYAAKRTLAQIVAVHEAHPELGPQSHALALVHMGDWHTLASQRSTATDLYRRAYQLLASANQEELLKKVFGAPVSVPSLRLTVEAVEKQLTKEDDSGAVTVVFDVSKSGRTSHVEVVETTHPENLLAIKKAKIFVKENTFRPRFENGEPADTTGVKVNIPIRVLETAKT